MYVYLSHKHTYLVELSVSYGSGQMKSTCHVVQCILPVLYSTHPQSTVRKPQPRFSPATNSEYHDTDTLGHCVIYHKAYHLHKPFRASIKPEMN